MDTDSFVVQIKTKDIYVDIAKDVETRFYTPYYKSERPLPRGKYKNVVGLMKDKLVFHIKSKNIQLFNNR